MSGTLYLVKSPWLDLGSTQGESITSVLLSGYVVQQPSGYCKCIP